MKVDPEEKKAFDAMLIEILAFSQRSLVSLRKEDWDSFEDDLGDLSSAAMKMLIDVGSEILPIERILLDREEDNSPLLLGKENLFTSKAK